MFLEERRYPPPREFAAQANAQPDIYEGDFEEFWETEGRERLSWFEPFTRLLEWEPPYAKWYLGGNMGMVPELPVAMLACARLGAPHTVVFGGFSAESLAGRLNDMECEVLVTQDEGWRRGARVPLKKNADEALTSSPSVNAVVVLRRTGGDVAIEDGRDRWWHELVEREGSAPETCPCEPMDSEDLLDLLYTSGTTAKPKGIVHTTAGYLAGVSTTHHNIFDIKPDSVWWCAADIGWVTGHSYIVYGPLCNGTTGVIYEGTRAAAATSSCAGPGRRCCAASTRSTIATSRRTGRSTPTSTSPATGRIDEDGDFWLLGRVDDVMNVSGHRISTIEVESALVDHREVAEAAVAARADATTGQAIVAFVSLKGGAEGSVEKLEELRAHVATKIGPIAKPANIVFTDELPKTRSGKIMRRLLRDVAENRPLGDTTTLADPTVVDEIRTRSQTERDEE